MHYLIILVLKYHAPVPAVPPTVLWIVVIFFFSSSFFLNSVLSFHITKAIDNYDDFDQTIMAYQLKRARMRIIISNQKTIVQLFLDRWLRGEISIQIFIYLVII